jgi:hypothetical protein
LSGRIRRGLEKAAGRRFEHPAVGFFRMATSFERGGSLRSRPRPAVRYLVPNDRSGSLAVADQRQGRTTGGARVGHSTNGSEPGYHVAAICVPPVPTRRFPQSCIGREGRVGSCGGALGLASGGATDKVFKILWIMVQCVNYRAISGCNGFAAAPSPPMTTPRGIWSRTQLARLKSDSNDQRDLSA